MHIINSAIIQCNEIESEASGSSEITETVEEIRSELVSTQNYVSTYLSDSDSISWEDSGSSLDSHREQLFYVCIGLTCFTLVIVMIVKYLDPFCFCVLFFVFFAFVYVCFLSQKMGMKKGRLVCTVQGCINVQFVSQNFDFCYNQSISKIQKLIIYILDELNWVQQ